jgi:hypothetical protein
MIQAVLAVPKEHFQAAYARITEVGATREATLHKQQDSEIADENFSSSATGLGKRKMRANTLGSRKSQSASTLDSQVFFSELLLCFFSFYFLKG